MAAGCAQRSVEAGEGASVAGRLISMRPPISLAEAIRAAYALAPGDAETREALLAMLGLTTTVESGHTTVTLGVWKPSSTEAVGRTARPPAAPIFLPAGLRRIQQPPPLQRAAPGARTRVTQTTTAGPPPAPAWVSGPGPNACGATGWLTASTAAITLLAANRARDPVGGAGSLRRGGGPRHGPDPGERRGETCARVCPSAPAGGDASPRRAGAGRSRGPEWTPIARTSSGWSRSSTPSSRTID